MPPVGEVKVKPPVSNSEVVSIGLLIEVGMAPSRFAMYGSSPRSVNENRFFNAWPDDLEQNLSMIDELGGPNTYNHYPTGWATAFSTPFKMFKRYTYQGGVCDPLVISWPAGTDGYTVVLKSTPTAQGRGPADAAAQQAINAGLRQVGVLNSSDYSSMNPGYYVTFTGVYTTESQAQAALPNARSKGFPTAYVRRVAD